MKHPRTAALTGGIASGKSTVSRIFQELGASVIDADFVARQVIAPGRLAWKEIIAHFSQDILLDNGQINRKTLGTIVFNQPKERRILEHIIHPRVIEEINCQERCIRSTDQECVILVDVPLLIEASMYTNYLTIIVVYVSEEIQLKRLMDRDNISEQIARQRIAVQMPLSEKVKYATHVINNAETIEQTRKQVETIYREISKNPVNPVNPV
jgi:dephospho-CoA kinase